MATKEELLAQLRATVQQPLQAISDEPASDKEALFAQLRATIQPPAQPEEQPQEPVEDQPIKDEFIDALKTVGGTLAEFAAANNRVVTGVVDLLGVDKAFNAASKFLGSDFRIPTLTEALVPPPGTFTEPGLIQDIAIGAGSAIPAALGFGQALRVGAQQLPALVSGAEGVLPGFLRTAGQVTPRADIAGGALAGAGEVVGGQIGEELGGEGELLSKESAETLGAFTGGVLAPLSPALLKAPKTAITNLLNIAKAKPTAEQAQILEAGRNQGLKVFTTDVVPPQTFLGRWTQNMSEKLGVLGIGQARKNQQVARQNVVESIADEFNINVDSDVTGQVVNSLNKTAARKMTNAQLTRNDAVQTFNRFGRVPTPNLEKTITSILRDQAKLAPKQNEALVDNLEKTLEASRNAVDFEVLAAIRTDIIDDVLSVKNKVDVSGFGFRSLGQLGAVKSAFDQDMALFSRKTGEIGRTAGRQWRAANRDISKELQVTLKTELARIFRSGETNPEQILPIITGGKLTQLKRLGENIGEKGEKAVRATIVQDALKKSKFLNGNVNPDMFATELNKVNMKRAVNQFFKGDDKKQLQGIGKLLNATRRAQQAALVTQTGQLLAPLTGAGMFGAAVTQDPLLAVASAVTVSTLLKAYERPAFRKLMIKIANAKKDSIIEQRLLDAAVPGILAGLQQAARQAPQQQIQALQQGTQQAGAQQ